MQQTNKYKLNLIETSDTFSPAALNENAQKLEAALNTKVDADAHDALDARVTALELHKFATGLYSGTGSGSGQIIELGFTPKVVIADDIDYTGKLPIVCSEELAHKTMEIVPGGFRAHSSPSWSSDGLSSNSPGHKYCYIALA